jgi:hypothetical protein
MLDKWIRIGIYILTGITFAILGWNCEQFLASEPISLKNTIPTEIITQVCVAIFLAIGIVITEVFLSNPSRPKLNLKLLSIPIAISTIVGLIIGTIAGGIAAFFNLKEVHQLFINLYLNSSIIARVTSWLLVGWAIGIAETLAWLWRSLEAKDPKRFQQRLKSSLWAVTVAALSASLLLEFLHAIGLIKLIKDYEDLLGFSILGLCLGIGLGLSTSPSYTIALKAGAGFEFINPDKYRGFINKIPIVNLPPKQQSNSSNTLITKLLNPIYSNREVLELIGFPEDLEIEEGLSIRLPSDGNIIIGSITNQHAHIQLEGLAANIGFIKIDRNKAVLKPNIFNKIEVDGELLDSRKERRLKHNTILTFYTEDDKNFYRFVCYNRFLDPLA